MNYKNNKLRFLTFLAVIILTSIGCDNKDCYKYYQAMYPFNMYANSDTINIGDTIFLKIGFSRSIINQASSDDFYLPDELVYHHLNMTTLDHDSVDLNSMYSTGSYNSFDIVNIVGDFGRVFNNSLVTINYLTRTDSVFGEFQLIARDTGVFVFMMSDAAFFNHNNELTRYDISLGNPDCYENYWHGLFTNQNTDNNYYIIQDNNATNEVNFTEYIDPNDWDKTSRNDRKYNLEFGSFSVVVKQ